MDMDWITNTDTLSTLEGENEKLYLAVYVCVSVYSSDYILEMILRIFFSESLGAALKFDGLCLWGERFFGWQDYSRDNSWRRLKIENRAPPTLIRSAHHHLAASQDGSAACPS